MDEKQQIKVQMNSSTSSKPSKQQISSFLINQRSSRLGQHGFLKPIFSKQYEMKQRGVPGQGTAGQGLAAAKKSALGLNQKESKTLQMSYAPVITSHMRQMSQGLLTSSQDIIPSDLPLNLQIKSKLSTMAQLQTSGSKYVRSRLNTGSSVVSKAERRLSSENDSNLGVLQDHMFNEPALDYIKGNGIVLPMTQDSYKSVSSIPLLTKNQQPMTSKSSEKKGKIEDELYFSNIMQTSNEAVKNNHTASFSDPKRYQIVSNQVKRKGGAFQGAKLSQYQRTGPSRLSSQELPRGPLDSSSMFNNTFRYEASNRGVLNSNTQLKLRQNRNASISSLLQEITQDPTASATSYQFRRKSCKVEPLDCRQL